MEPIATLDVIVVDTPDPAGMAAFYSALTGWEVDADDPADDWAQLIAPSGLALAFQLAPGNRPPDWPSDQHPQQLHLDFAVPDLDEGEARVLAIGATKAEHQPGTRFRVFLDPSGHPFCLILGG